MTAGTWASFDRAGFSGSAGRVARTAEAKPSAHSEASQKNLRMKAARVAADMSQADLAEAVGATRQTIGLIEAGGYNPTLKLCVAICKTLGCTLDDLFWEGERPRD